MASRAPLPASPGAGPRASTGSRSRWLALAALALPAALYLATLYPGIGDRAASGDAVEFQTVGRALSIAHEPGYPQYVALSFLWSWLPLPLTLATKINLFSAVLALAAGGIVFITARAATGHAIASVLVCWALLTAPDLWLLATQAEVYTLHVFWVALFFYAALRWRRDGERRKLLFLLFVYALAFGNHLTMIALLPALGWLLLSRQPRLATDFTAWAWATVAAAVGAAQYLLLVWRSYVPHPTLLERFPLRAGLGEILAYVTGDRFVEKHWLPLGAGEWLDRVGRALLQGSEQIHPLFAGLAIWGAIVGWRRDASRVLFLLLALVSVVLFAAAYDIRDWLLYCIPAWVAAALLAADGIAHLAKRLPRVGLALAFVLGLVLAPRIVRGVDELRVPDNPADLTTVLAALPAEARVISAGGQRLSRLHEDYYRYGAGIEAAKSLRFLAARQDVLHKGLHLRRRGFFFRSPTVVKIFSGRLIDFRIWPEWQGSGGPVFVTGTDDPLAEVDLRALPDSVLQLEVREALRTLGDEKDLYLFIIDGRDGRAKGLEAVGVEDEGAADRLRLVFSTIPAGDLVVLLAPSLRPPGRAAVDDLLAAAGLDPISADTERLVAAWRLDGEPRRARRWENPVDGEAWTVTLADL